MMAAHIHTHVYSYPSSMAVPLCSYSLQEHAFIGLSKLKTNGRTYTGILSFPKVNFDPNRRRFALFSPIHVFVTVLKYENTLSGAALKALSI